MATPLKKTARPPKSGPSATSTGPPTGTLGRKGNIEELALLEFTETASEKGTDDNPTNTLTDTHVEVIIKNKSNDTEIACKAAERPGKRGHVVADREN